MKILLLGKDGQVGWELQRSLAPLGQLTACGREEANLEDLQHLRELVRKAKPDVIVNAAAYTAVDKAEADTEKASRINAEVPQVLAEEAKRLNAWLVHYSTDYVFNGSKASAYVEDDPTDPLSAYGRTKLEGERAITASGCRHLTFRTSWVYAARGGNFAKTMLRLAREREKLSVISDQVGAPTGADLLADVTAHAIRTAQGRPGVSGLYHLVASGETSWHGYASFVIDFARRAGVEIRVPADAIKPIPTSAYPLPAKRPHNSRLATAKLREAFDVSLPDWQQGVTRMLTEILERQQ